MGSTKPMVASNYRQITKAELGSTKTIDGLLLGFTKAMMTS